MWNRIRTLRFPQSRQWMFLGLTLVLSAAAFYLGKVVGVAPLIAQPTPTPPGLLPTSITGEDNSKRVVAVIYGNIPITRNDLAEHLIARTGSKRLDFLINSKIVERECKQNNVVITDAEVEQQFQKDLADMKLNRQQFQDQVLHRFQKSIFEWKEDVIRPKLCITRLVQPLVVLNQKDLVKGFEAKYGDKVQCRMIAYQNMHLATAGYQLISNSANLVGTFNEEAGKQFVQHLAARKGEIPPIHHHFSDERIEREAFSLRPGQISRIFEVDKETHVLLLCEKHIPGDKTKRFEEERFLLEKEIYEQKLAEKIPEYMKQLWERANPQKYLEQNMIRLDDFQRQHPAYDPKSTGEFSAYPLQK